MAKETLLIRILVALLFSCTLNADDSIAVRETQTQRQRIGTSSIHVELREEFDSATFAVKGLSKLDLLQKLKPAELQKSLAIRVHQPDNSNALPPMLGKYSVTDTELRFTSQFPLSPSIQYRVELDSQLMDGLDHEQAIVFSSRPRKRIPAATVAAVYPSADVLPENLLKFYLHFSSPMSRGEAYTRIHLMSEGQEVDSPFLELGEELWDAEQKRFTLFIHPGRIKRGLKPREDSGTPMVAGKEYTLRIDADWLGADQQPMAAAFAKQFRVIGADDMQPDYKKWKVDAPKANSKQPVYLTFDEPLDHAMLSRVVQVRDASKADVIGTVTISAKETVWSFEPKEPWGRGTYSIVLDTNLEDLVGNNLSRLFETKEQQVESDLKVEAEMAIPFVVQ